MLAALLLLLVGSVLLVAARPRQVLLPASPATGYAVRLPAARAMLRTMGAKTKTWKGAIPRQ